MMIRIYLPVTFALLAVSSAAILIRICDAPALSIAAYRILIASAALLIWNASRKNKFWQGLNREDLWLSLLSGFFLAVHFSAWISSLKLTSVTKSTVLVATSPFWVALASRFIFKKKLKPGLLFSFLIAFSGILLMTWFSAAEVYSQDSKLGDLLALIGAWAAAGYILCGRVVRKKVSTLAYITIAYSFCGILLFLSAIVLAVQMWDFPPAVYALLLLIALVPQLIGHSTFNWALKYLSAPLVSTLLLGEPVFASALAFFFLQESPTSLQIGGSLLVVGGVAGAIWSEK